MNITPDLLRRMRLDIDEALAPVAAKYKLKRLALGRGTYGEEYFTFQLQGVAEGGKDAAAVLYETYRESFGLPALGFTFKQGDAVHVVVGLNKTGTKVIAETPDGKRWLFPNHAIKAKAKAAA